MLATLLTAVIVFIILVVAVFVLERLFPMGEPWRTAIRAAVAVGFLLWLLYLAKAGAFAGL